MTSPSDIRAIRAIRGRFLSYREGCRSDRRVAGPTEGSRAPWFLLTAGLIGLIALFQFLQWPLLPRFLDVYYHLGVAQGFDQAGGYVSHAFWECAPAGRPQLYPPLLHVLLLGAHRLGLDWISVGRLAEAIMFPAFLAALACAVTVFGSATAGFFATLVASSIFPLYLEAGILLPFTLAVTLGLLAAAALRRSRLVTAAILLGLALHAHLLMGAIALVAIVLYGAAVPGQRPRVLRVAAAALLMAAPLLIHVARHAASFAVVRVRESRTLEIDPLTFLLALAGLTIALRRRGALLLPVAFWLAALPLAFTHPVRFAGGLGLVGPVWLAGVALAEAWGWAERRSPSRRAARLLVPLVMLLFLAVTPMLHVNVPARSVRLRFFDRTVTHYLLPESWRTVRPKEATVYVPEAYARLAEIVRAKAAPDEAIWSDFAQGAGILSLLTGRPTSSAMMLEVRPSKPFDPIAAARVTVLFKSAALDSAAIAAALAERHRLQPAGETDLAYVLINPAPVPRLRVPPPTIPLAGILATGFLAVAFVMLDIRRRTPDDPVGGR